jgi:hypothetical protein
MRQAGPTRDREASHAVAPLARHYLLFFALAASMQILASGGYLTQVWHGSLIDPDSYMRLLRIEQGLKLGHLVNTIHGRDDSGAALVIEWSRLFDAALVMLAAPLVPWLGWHKALYWAGVVSGPMAAGFLGLSLCFAVAPLVTRGWLWSTAMFAPLTYGIWAFEFIGTVNYRIVMVAATAVTAGFTLRAAGVTPFQKDDLRPGPARRGAGFAAGVAGGIAVWISSETMPFALLCFVGIGWSWMFRRTGNAIAASGLGFLATLALGLWCDPPAGGYWARELDRLSFVYLALGFAVAGAALWLAALDRMTLSPGWRRVLGLAGALGAFALWLGAFPSVALGPYALLPADQMRLFFGAALEAQPVHGIANAVEMLAPGLLALAAILARVWQTGRWGEARGAWVIMAVTTLFALGLTARFILFARWPAALGAAMLPVALAGVTRRFAARPNVAAAARIGLVAALVVAPYAGGIAAARSGRLAARPGSVPPVSCAMRRIGPLLAPAAGQIALSGVAEVPELLYRSRIIAVGSLYQHGVEGYLRARAAWRAPVGTGTQPPAAVRATGAGFVLFCPRSGPDALARGAPPDALWFALSAGHPPPWLRLVGTLPGTGFRLYRITPSAGG